METKINKSIELYITSFKDNVRDKINSLHFEDNSKINELVEFIYDYERLSIAKNELLKPKRVKNSIPLTHRCVANRANGEQCTRRRKDNCELCGTHYKGVPHGMVTKNDNANPITQKLEVFAEDIRGIVYYIDNFENVYKTEDIIEAKQNPQIIAKWVKVNNKYTIPEFGL